MKSVLVTGGTVRLGLVIADHLRGLGYRVLTTSSRGDSAADIVADFRESLGAAKCYAAALNLLGGNPPDAVVNNAALFTGPAPDIEAINLTAPKKLTMLMAGREVPGRGCVVNILDATESEKCGAQSAGGGVQSAECGARSAECGAQSAECGVQSAGGGARSAKYSESKRELRNFTRSAAVMFSETLRVNSVSPGPIDELRPVGVHEKAGDCPLGRPKAVDVARAVAFLIENESVTGVDVPVDGGLSVSL